MRFRNTQRGGAATIVVVAALVVVGVLAGYILYNSMVIARAINVDTFYHGIYVDDIPLGGLTMEQARAQIQQKQQEQLQQVSVGAAFESQSWEFGAGDILCTADTDAILQQAFALGRSGSSSKRYEEVNALAENPVRLHTTLVVDPSPLREQAQLIADALYIQPIDADITGFHPDQPIASRFEYRDEQPGRRVDAEQLYTQLAQQIDTQAYGTVQVAVQSVPPAVTRADLASTTQLIAEFTSKMANSANREDNIELACQQISGHVLLPGEVFSFNEATGERTAAAGYKEAGIISGGKMDVGLAGGVCQVSGTLYNAAFRADLEILERRRHSFVLSYLGAGTDATVDYGNIDLRFRNNKEHPIFIAMYADKKDNLVHAEIYGDPLPGGVTISMDTKIIATTKPGDPTYKGDASVPAGTKVSDRASHTGVKVAVYKVYSKDGVETSRTLAYEDNYPPITAVYLVNPGELKYYKGEAPWPTPTPAPTTPTPRPSTTTPPPTPTPTPDDDVSGDE